MNNKKGSKLIYLPILGLLFLINSFVFNSPSVKESQTNKSKIIYVFDPLCGWCYGFEPVMIDVQKNYSDKFDFDFVPGGMVTKSNAQPLNNMRAYLIKAIPNLESRTGITIDQAYYDNMLNNDTVVLDSEVPSQVFLLAKKNYIGNEVKLIQEIQDKLYKKGLHLSDLNNYNDINFNKAKVSSPEATKLMNESFAKSRKLSVRGYPALLIEKNGKYELLSSGYISYNKLSKKLDDFVIH